MSVYSPSRLLVVFFWDFTGPYLLSLLGFVLALVVLRRSSRPQGVWSQWAVRLIWLGYAGTILGLFVAIWSQAGYFLACCGGLALVSGCIATGLAGLQGRSYALMAVGLGPLLVGAWSLWAIRNGEAAYLRHGDTLQAGFVILVLTTPSMVLLAFVRDMNSRVTMLTSVWLAIVAMTIFGSWAFPYSVLCDAYCDASGLAFATPTGQHDTSYLEKSPPTAFGASEGYTQETEASEMPLSHDVPTALVSQSKPCSRFMDIEPSVLDQGVHPPTIDQIWELDKWVTDGDRENRIALLQLRFGMSTDLGPRYQIFLIVSLWSEMANLSATYDLGMHWYAAAPKRLSKGVYRYDKASMFKTESSWMRVLDADSILAEVSNRAKAAYSKAEFDDGPLHTPLKMTEYSARADCKQPDLAE